MTSRYVSAEAMTVAVSMSQVRSVPGGSSPSSATRVQNTFCAYRVCSRPCCQYPAISGSTAAACWATANSAPVRSMICRPTAAPPAIRPARAGAVMASIIQSRPSTSTGSVSPTTATSITRLNSAAFVPNRTYTVRAATRARRATASSVVAT
ncbi:MAG TPA: hypothetical protein VGF32_10000 [Streptosporangiaceae bacterium]